MCLAIRSLLSALIPPIQVFVLWTMNKRKERERVAAGLPAKLHDFTMDSKFDNAELVADKRLANDELDPTDKHNIRFVYLY